MSWRLSDLPPHLQDQAREQLRQPESAAKPPEGVEASKRAGNKYGAVKTEYNGRRFDSKREAAYAAELDLRQAAGEIVGYLEQVPFRLPGGIVYRADFLEVYPDGSLRLIDVKGFITPVFRIKQRLMSEFYSWLPLEVVE